MNSESEAIARKLETCPLWIDVPANDIDRRVKITEIYVDLSKYDTAIVRDGIALYLRRHITDSLSYQFYIATDKVEAFLRVMFKVPLGPGPANMLLYGNYSDADPAWPFSIDGEGHLQLTGVMGFRSGPVSDALSDFDHIASRFARRFPVRQ